MTPQAERAAGALPPWAAWPLRIPSLLNDLPIVVSGLALFYGLLSLTRYWIGPVNTQPWQKFLQLELPYSRWFFLMACEMFVLGNRDLRLPGLGSYLQTAANAGNSRAILWGVAVMIAIIVLIDQLIWRPLIAWSEKFKFEQVEAAQAPRSLILDWLRHSRLLSRAARSTVELAREAILLHFAKRNLSRPGSSGKSKSGSWTARVLGLAAVAGAGYAVAKMVVMLTALSSADLRGILWGAGATHRVRWGVERKHCRGVFPIPRADLRDYWIGSRDQPRYR